MADSGSITANVISGGTTQGNITANSTVISRSSSSGVTNGMVVGGGSGSGGTNDYNQLINKPVLSTVATSGSYTDLLNKPTIPTQYTDAQAAAAAPVQSVAGRTGVVTLTKSDVGLANVDNTSDANKPVSTAQQTALDGKQATLVSGTNIKTVNGNSLLGSGDLTISSGTGDMTKAVYDTNNDGVVDNSQALQGQNSAYHLNRTNHTGTQAISTVSGLQTALDAKQVTVTLTTTGTSGAATFNSVTGALNIPNYATGSGSAGITRSVNAISAAATVGSTTLVDYVYYWTGSTAYNQTMPAASGNTNRYTFINRSSISQTVIGTFNGQTNIVISPNSVREFISNNTDWMVL